MLWWTIGGQGHGSLQQLLWAGQRGPTHPCSWWAVWKVILSICAATPELLWRAIPCLEWTKERAESTGEGREGGKEAGVSRSTCTVPAASVPAPRARPRPRRPSLSPARLSSTAPVSPAPTLEGPGHSNQHGSTKTLLRCTSSTKLAALGSVLVHMPTRPEVVHAAAVRTKLLHRLVAVAGVGVGAPADEASWIAEEFKGPHQAV